MFFSVIVSVYNVVDYLDECLDSIMAQTFKDYELIIIDDGSTDGSAAICDRYGDDDCVTVIHQENRGLPQSRQRGLNMAKGDYVVFVDGDDWVEEKHLETRYERLKDGGAEVLWSAAYNHCWGDVYMPVPTESMTHKKLVQARFHNKVTPYVWNMTYQRAFLECHQINFGRYGMAEDEFFNIQVFYDTDHIAYDSRATYHHRYNPQSMSNSKTREMQIATFTDMLGNLEDLNRMFHFSDDDYLRPSFYHRVNEIKKTAVRRFYSEPVVLDEFLNVLPESARYLKIRRPKDIGVFLALKYRCYIFYRLRNGTECLRNAEATKTKHCATKDSKDESVSVRKVRCF